MSNPFIDRNARHTHGQKSEKKTAKRMGVSARPGSGALEGAKGDILLTEYLLENKCTEHFSLSLKLSWLEKISVEAREIGKLPGLSLQFVDKHGASRPHGRWVLIPEDEFKDTMIETETSHGIS